MTKIVREAVVLMDVLAGYDGIDDRQPYMLKVGNIKFVEGVDEALKAENPLAGMNVGVMKEGFEYQAKIPLPLNSSNPRRKVRRALVRRSTSSRCRLVSTLRNVWMANIQIAGIRQGLLSDATG